MVRLDGTADGVVVVGEREVPFYRLDSAPLLPATLYLKGASFRFRKSYPNRGWSAAAPADLLLLGREGQRVFVLRRGRFCLYVADAPGPTPAPQQL